MRRFQATRCAWPCLFLVLALSGCSLLGSTEGTPTLSPEQVQATVNTLVTLTVAAIPASLEITPTQASLDTLTPARTPTPPGPTVTATRPLPTASPSPTPVCDRAMAGSPIDVSIPDDSVMVPGQSFTKIWRIQNIGICTWSKSYSARFFYGMKMDAPDQVSLIKEVPPGESVEISVDMVAPATPGAYQGNWKLANAMGQFFGIGPNGDSPFWVRIQVVPAQETATPAATSVPAPSATPSQTPTPTPLVRASGTLEMAVNSEVDLDSGTIAPTTGADLSYRKEDGYHNLLPINGAEMGVYGNSEPPVSACQTAAMSTAPIALESLSPGVYLCIQSDADLYGWLLYNNVDSTSESADLEFKTWAGP